MIGKKPPPPPWEGGIPLGVQLTSALDSSQTVGFPAKLGQQIPQAGNNQIV